MGYFPPADATREEVDAWRREHAPTPSLDDPEHEAPPIENGPSLMCNACGVVRINIFNGLFCKGCMKQIADATGETL